MAAKKKASGSRKAAAKKTTKKKTRTTKAAARKVAARKQAGRSRVKPRRQPESLRLHSASPSLTVGDVQRSLAFYRDVLGFTEKERWQQDGVLRGVEMSAGNVSFWLGQDDWKKGRDRIKGQGFRLYCSTRQDIDALAAQIKARGGTLAEEPTNMSWGGRALGIVDPDGFAITIANET
jgi:predicted enzyme related to lactoylglutathione lyase